MLNQIKNWLESHHGENSGLVKSIRDSLNDYEAKVNDLRAMVQEAAAQTKQASGLNQKNEKALESIRVSLVRIHMILYWEGGGA